MVTIYIEGKEFNVNYGKNLIEVSNGFLYTQGVIKSLEDLEGYNAEGNSVRVKVRSLNNGLKSFVDSSCGLVVPQNFY
jgi:formate dehydrogenase assembly factor FdhD